MARVYIHQKIKSGRLDPHFFAVSRDDLAIDCIAVLFERNDLGEFIRIKNYFRSIDVNELGEDMLLRRTRQLIFTVVNDELFRLYKIEDPSLGNVIRSIKSALKYIPDLFAERIGGEIWLYVGNDKDSRADLPIIPYDLIYLLFQERFSSTLSTLRLIREFTGILKSQLHYRKRYPLTGLAYLIRTIYASMAETEYEYESTSSPDFHIREEDLRILIKASTLAVKSRMEARYVSRKKIPPKIYNLFFPAIESILVAQYVENDGFDRSFSEFVKMHNSELSGTQYTAQYRSYFEYLVKLSREELIHKIKREI